MYKKYGVHLLYSASSFDQNWIHIGKKDITEVINILNAKQVYVLKHITGLKFL